MWMRCDHIVRIYSAQNRKRRMEKSIICPDRGTNVHRQLQRRSQRPGDCTWDCTRTLLMGTRQIEKGTRRFSSGTEENEKTPVPTLGG